MLKLKILLSIGHTIGLLSFMIFVSTSVSRAAFLFFNVSMIRDISSAVAGLRNKELTTLAGGGRASSESTGLIDFAISEPIWETIINKSLCDILRIG